MAGKARTKPTKAKAPRKGERLFEATCPTCGMTADVPAHVEQARCQQCGTVIQLVDHEVPPPAPAPAGEPALAPGRTALAIVVGILGPLAVGIAFGSGHIALDQPEPDTGAAGRSYLAAVLLGAAAVFALWPCMGPGRVFPRALWGLFSAVPTFVVAMLAGQAYDDDGFAWALLGYPLLGIYLLAVGITAAVQANRGDGSAAATALIGGVGLCAGLAFAALYMLMTLQEQAMEAREAHEAPTFQAIAVILLLFGLAAWRRRR